jgi:hypothetical protein
VTTPAFRWCVLHLDTDDQDAVVAHAGGLLGPGTELDVFRSPGFSVQVERNPDRTRGPHFLDWPTIVDIGADDDTPDADVVAFVTALIRHFHEAGLRVGAECDFPDKLPPPERR